MAEMALGHAQMAQRKRINSKVNMHKKQKEKVTCSDYNVRLRLKRNECRSLKLKSKGC